jgi:transcriptional antiterminator RfaH
MCENEGKPLKNKTLRVCLALVGAGRLKCQRFFTIKKLLPEGVNANLLSSSKRNLDSHCGVNRLWSVSNVCWFVAHTRPRCEKKLAQFCQREGLSATLPCYRSPRKYRGKTVVFQKPLFPGYVFLQMSNEHRAKIWRNDYIANLLEVTDQEHFIRQMADVLRAVESDLEIRLAPAIGEGTRVKINNGPLRGVEGWVERRYGMNTVLLRLDFIGQAAAVKLNATDLEPV